MNVYHPVISTLTFSKYVCSSICLVRMQHHPMNFSLIYSKVSLGSGFVKISPCCSFVSTLTIINFPDKTHSLKWWYFIAMCLVLGLYFGTFASSSAPLLSSNRVHFIVNSVQDISNILDISNIRPLMGIRSLAAVDKAMYSASVVLRAISV